MESASARKISPARRLFLHHTSFLVLAAGTGAVFVLNIGLKGLLTAADYGRYSLLMTWISIVTAFGLFGLDQLLLRVAVVRSGAVAVNRALAIATIPAAVVSAAIASVAVRASLEDVAWYQMFAICVAICIVGLASSLLRLQAKFTRSQLALNAWKLALAPAIAAAIALGGALSFASVLSRVVWALVANAAVAAWAIARQPLTTESASEPYGKLLLGFLLSLGLVTFLNFSDRFFIEARFGIAELGEYFYLQNFFVYPMLFLSTYIGFKDLVLFKKQPSMALIHARLRVAATSGLVLAVVMLAAAGVLGAMNLGKSITWSQLPTILALVVVAIVRLAYSVLSAAMGALADGQAVLRANLISLVQIIAGLLLAYWLATSVLHIVLMFALLWLARAGLFYAESRRFCHA